MMNKRKQNWCFNVSEAATLSPHLYDVVLLLDAKFCKHEFEFLVRDFFHLTDKKLKQAHKDLLESGELVIARYTKDVAETKGNELEIFMKENKLKFRFVIRKG